MVNYVNYGARFRPSVDLGREALNARYHNNAMQRAMEQSVFSCSPVMTSTSVSYDNTFATANLIGNIAGDFLSNLPNMLNVGKNIWSKLFG